MSGQQPSSIGEQIKDAVQSGIATGDFRDLNQLVNESVNIAINEALTRSASMRADKMDRMQSFSKRPTSRTGSTGTRQERSEAFPIHYERDRDGIRVEINRPERDYDKGSHGEARDGKKPRKPYFRLDRVMKKEGQVVAILARVFGGITVAWSSLLTIAGFASGEPWIGFFFGVILAFAAFFVRLGANRCRLLKRAERYARVANTRMYVTLDELEHSTQYTRKRILSDIKKCLQLGIYPKGHLDAQETCLMLNEELYRQYQETENNRRQKEAEAQPRALTPEEEMAKMQAERSSELDQMIAEGRECTRKLRELNDAIEGEVISAKLYRLEDLLNEIFDKVKQYPEQMSQMHTMMNYYLPTTIKLVEAYKEFDQVSAPGTDILSAKAEIEKTLDTINEAFTELLNKLFKDRLVDVSTDVQVLQAMLAREGLSKDGLMDAVSQASNGPELVLTGLNDSQ